MVMEFVKMLLAVVIGSLIAAGMVVTGVWLLVR